MYLLPSAADSTMTDKVSQSRRTLGLASVKPFDWQSMTRDVDDEKLSNKATTPIINAVNVYCCILHKKYTKQWVDLYQNGVAIVTEKLKLILEHKRI